MKKTLCLLLAALCLFGSLAACAENEVPSGENIRVVTISCTGDALIGSNETVRKKGAGSYSYDTFVVG